ncbi:hypothetical protein ACJX0J_019994, partial [Zea mays]
REITKISTKDSKKVTSKRGLKRKISLDSKKGEENQGPVKKNSSIVSGSFDFNWDIRKFLSDTYSTFIKRIWFLPISWKIKSGPKNEKYKKGIRFREDFRKSWNPFPEKITKFILTIFYPKFLGQPSLTIDKLLHQENRKGEIKDQPMFIRVNPENRHQYHTHMILVHLIDKLPSTLDHLRLAAFTLPQLMQREAHFPQASPSHH